MVTQVVVSLVAGIMVGAILAWRVSERNVATLAVALRDTESRLRYIWYFIRRELETAVTHYCEEVVAAHAGLYSGVTSAEPHKARLATYSIVVSKMYDASVSLGTQDETYELIAATMVERLRNKLPPDTTVGELMNRVCSGAAHWRNELVSERGLPGQGGFPVLP